MNVCIPSHSYVEASPPSVVAFGDGASMEINTVK